MLRRGIELYPQWRNIEMKWSPFFGNQKYVCCLIANTMCITKLIINIRALLRKITDNELGFLNEIGYLVDDETCTDIFIYSFGFQLQFAAFIFNGRVDIIHFLPFERHHYKHKPTLKFAFIIWIIIICIKLLINKRMISTHHSYLQISNTHPMGDQSSSYLPR